MADLIKEIKTLDKEHRGLQKDKLKLREEQAEIIARHRDEEQLFTECLAACNDKILSQ